MNLQATIILCSDIRPYSAATNHAIPTIGLARTGDKLSFLDVGHPLFLPELHHCITGLLLA